MGRLNGDGIPMIQTLSHRLDGGRTLYLRPNRALSRRAWIGWYAAIVLVCLLVTSWSAWHGNVFAPLFALLDLALVAWAFAMVWQAGERAEWIEMAPDCITVRRERQGSTVEAGRFHPAWVRLVRQAQGAAGGNDPLLLRSHGRTLEIGAFLAEEERNQLAVAMRQALAELKVGPGAPGMG